MITYAKFAHRYTSNCCYGNTEPMLIALNPMDWFDLVHLMVLDRFTEEGPELWEKIRRQGWFVFRDVMVVRAVDLDEGQMRFWIEAPGAKFVAGTEFSIMPRMELRHRLQCFEVRI